MFETCYAMVCPSTLNIMNDGPDMISAKQIKVARLFLDWEQRDLAQKSGLSLPTIQRMEKFGVERSSVGNAEKVRKSLEEGGVEFIPQNGGGEGVRLKKGRE
jgi:hypothetical protein